MTKKLSVLVPAFQVGRFLDSALASVVSQPFTDLEVIVVNDGSSDETLEVAASWSIRDRRIRVVSNPGRCGMVPTWNRALREARGELVFKLDGDDALEPGSLADLVEQFEQHPGLQFAAFRTWECNPQLEIVESFSGEELWARLGWGDPSEDRCAPGWWWFPGCFEDHQPWHSSALLVPRKTLLEAGGWDERWGCAADTDLILRLLATEKPVLHRGRFGVRYRRHETSVSFQAEREGWKSLEAVLVPVLALSRNRSQVLRRPRLRWNWFRLDQARRSYLSDFEASRFTLPAERKHLRELAEGVPTPPAWVRAEGQLRVFLWRLFAKRKRGG